MVSLIWLPITRQPRLDHGVRADGRVLDETIVRQADGRHIVLFTRRAANLIWLLSWPVLQQPTVGRQVVRRHTAVLPYGHGLGQETGAFFQHAVNVFGQGRTRP